MDPRPRRDRRRPGSSLRRGARPRLDRPDRGRARPPAARARAGRLLLRAPSRRRADDRRVRAGRAATPDRLDPGGLGVRRVRPRLGALRAGPRERGAAHPRPDGRRVHPIPPRARVLHAGLQFCLGETAEVRNLYVAAGFNSQGSSTRRVRGAPSRDGSRRGAHRSTRRRSTSAASRRPRRTSATCTSARRRPSDACTRCTGRTSRRRPRAGSAGHRSTTASRPRGACFGELTQWERANWFAPPGVEPVYEYSFGRQNWFPYAAEEHRAAREAVALFDLSSFAKIEVSGTDALATPAAGLHERRRRRDRPRGLHAVPQRTRRHRERRNRDAARQRIASWSSRRPRRSTARSSGSAPTAGGRRCRSRT